MIALAVPADRFEQRARAVEIDPVALVEVELGLARHHAGEVEDHIRARRQELLGFARVGEIADKNVERRPRLRALLQRLIGKPHDVVERQLVDWLPMQRAVRDQPQGQLAPDHARRAGDEDMQGALPLWFAGYYRTSSRRPRPATIARGQEAPAFREETTR